MSKYFFNQAQTKAITDAIKQAELHTSGEIRVHVQKNLKHDNVMQEAEYVFGKLGMQNTKDRNGVLFLLSTQDHHFAIYADKGINQAVPSNFWEQIKDQTIPHFKEGKFQEGLCAGILKTGEKLKDFFPFSITDDTNELDDEISYE